MKQFDYITEIQAHSLEISGNNSWFSQANMSLFGTRFIDNRVYAGNIFVSTNILYNEDNRVIMYVGQVLQYTDNGTVITIYEVDNFKPSAGYEQTAIAHLQMAVSDICSKTMYAVRYSLGYVEYYNIDTQQWTECKVNFDKHLLPKWDSTLVLAQKVIKE